MEEVKLTKVEVNFAKALTKEEMTFREGKPEKAFWADKSPEERFRDMVLAKCCEIAVSKFTGLSHNYQIGFQTPMQADVGNIIEVKCKFTNAPNFSFPSANKFKKAIVACSAAYDEDGLVTVTIYGYLFSEELEKDFKKTKSKNGGGDYYAIPATALKNDWIALLTKNLQTKVVKTKVNTIEDHWDWSK